MSEEPKVENSVTVPNSTEEPKENIVIDIFKKLLEINFQEYGKRKEF